MKVKGRNIESIKKVKNDVELVRIINILRRIGLQRLIEEKYPYFKDENDTKHALSIKIANLQLLESKGSTRALKEIFEQDGNVRLLSLSGNELIELTTFIINSELIPQEYLELPFNSSYGIEWEFQGVRKEEVEHYVRTNFEGYQVVDELTVTCGGEIVSPPILINNERIRITIANYLIETIKLENNIDLSNDMMAIIQIFGLAEQIMKEFEERKSTQINAQIKTAEGMVTLSKFITKAEIQNLHCRRDEIRNIGNKLKELGVKEDTNTASIQIQIGAHFLGNDIERWRKFLKIWIIYEDILFRFFYGERLCARTALYRYSPPVSQRLYSILPLINSAKHISDLENILPESKYTVLNFENVCYSEPEQYNYGNTIEIRCGNFTCKEEIITNYIACILNILGALDSIDEEFLDKKIEEIDNEILGNYYSYNEVNLKKSLEFVDLTCHNLHSKLNFLIQYIKGFQYVYSEEAVPILRAETKKIPFVI